MAGSQKNSYWLQSASEQQKNQKNQHNQKTKTGTGAIGVEVGVMVEGVIEVVS
jgi:hypothetical protein